MKNTIFTIKQGSENAAKLAAELIARSKWFTVEPLPEDEFEFQTKNEPGLPDTWRSDRSPKWMTRISS